MLKTTKWQKLEKNVAKNKGWGWFSVNGMVKYNGY